MNEQEVGLICSDCLKVVPSYQIRYFRRDKTQDYIDVQLCLECASKEEMKNKKEELLQL